MIYIKCVSRLNLVVNWPKMFTINVGKLTIIMNISYEVHGIVSLSLGQTWSALGYLP